MTFFTSTTDELIQPSKMLKADFLPSQLHTTALLPRATSQSISVLDDCSTRRPQAELDYKAELIKALTLIAEPLQRCELVISEALVGSNRQMQPLLDYVKGLGGKRLRPALLLLSSQMFGPVSEESVRLAAVVELVHTATLVHDDILDGAAYRRHRATLHCKWDEQTAILVGDWLFTQAYGLANAGDSTLPGRWIAWAAKSVCEGEIAQTLSAGDPHLGQSEYIQMLGGKTGALCAISCGLGAWASGASRETCESLYDFGMKLGIAFQIHDDWLDVWGEQNEIGKAVGADLKGKKWTLPLLRYRDVSSKPSFEQLQRILNTEEIDLELIRARLAETDAEAYTRSLAQHYVDEALNCIQELNGSPEHAALKRLAHAAVNRTR